MYYINEETKKVLKAEIQCLEEHIAEMYDCRVRCCAWTSGKYVIKGK